MNIHALRKLYSELRGQPHGKPMTAEQAIRLLQAIEPRIAVGEAKDKIVAAIEARGN